MPLAAAAVLTLACMNATMADSEAIAKLREAQTALDEGDVETARSIANEVRSHRGYLDDTADLGERATRIESLSFVRDPSARPEEIQNAVSVLHHALGVRTQIANQPPTPQLDADYGEALERAGNDDEAYRILVPLADHDVLGSAYAYAALGRMSERKGDAMHARMSRERCMLMTTRQSTCRGEYPPRPFVRGRAFDFALAGIVVLGAALTRLVRKRPWSEHRERELSGAISIGGWGLFLVANARLGALAALLAVVFAFVLGLIQRRLFLRAAAEGEVNGLQLRPLEPGDESVPLLRLFFGPHEAQTLEPTGSAAGYRDSARRPLLRIGRREVPRRAIVLSTVLILILAGILVSAATLTRGV